MKWQKNKGLDVLTNPTHSSYLKSLCETFSSALEEKISDLAELLCVHRDNPVYQEVLCHGAYCKKVMKNFVVSVDALVAAFTYPLRCSCNYALGCRISGTAKSKQLHSLYSLMSKNPGPYP